jgi:cation/acetate symporter
MMRRLTQFSTALGLLAVAALAYAGGPLEGVTEKQATNWHAIIMFCIFVTMTMGITYWASSRTKSTADFYTAGGGITASRTAWQLPATTCRPPRCSV